MAREINHSIGEKIKSLRKQKNISASKLSEMAKISKGYLSEIESGKRINLSVKMLKKISEALDIKVEYLYDEGTIINPFLTENILIEKFKKLNISDQNKFIQLLEVWANG